MCFFSSFFIGAAFECPYGYTGAYPGLNAPYGDLGYIGTVSCDGKSSTLDSSAFCPNAVNSIDVYSATTITLDLSPGARAADLRVTFQVKGHSDIIFRYEAAYGLSTPSDKVVESDYYEELSFIVPGAAQNQLIKSIIIYVSAAPGCSVSVSNICIYECVSGK